MEDNKKTHGWDYEKNKLLIKLVKRKPELYDINNPEYGDIALRNDGWHAIGVQLNEYSADCSKRWRSLKQNYRRYVNGLPIGTKNGKRICIHEKHMSFMNKFIVNGKYITAKKTKARGKKSKRKEIMNTHMDIKYFEDTTGNNNMRILNKKENIKVDENKWFKDSNDDNDLRERKEIMEVNEDVKFFKDTGSGHNLIIPEIQEMIETDGNVKSVKDIHNDNSVRESNREKSTELVENAKCFKDIGSNNNTRVSKRRESRNLNENTRYQISNSDNNLRESRRKEIIKVDEDVKYIIDIGSHNLIVPKIEKIESDEDVKPVKDIHNDNTIRESKTEKSTELVGNAECFKDIGSNNSTRVSKRRESINLNETAWFQISNTDNDVNELRRKEIIKVDEDVKYFIDIGGGHTLIEPKIEKIESDEDVKPVKDIHNDNSIRESKTGKSTELVGNAECFKDISSSDNPNTPKRRKIMDANEDVKSIDMNNVNNLQELKTEEIMEINDDVKDFSSSNNFKELGRRTIETNENNKYFKSIYSDNNERKLEKKEIMESDGDIKCIKDTSSGKNVIESEKKAMIEDYSPLTQLVMCKRKRIMPTEDAPTKSTPQNITNFLTQNKNEENATHPIDTFFSLMAQSVKTFNSADQHFVKTNIFSLITKLEERYILQNQQLPTYQHSS